jgi:flagellum-specific peptidoglycan hydrolase FlgJ
MEQMRRYGIPASVTLLRVSSSLLTVGACSPEPPTTHFGVKGEYNGQYVRADDDKPNEKFKKYDNVGQSYEGHSKVLMGDRYQKYTKNLSPDEYKGWAQGIKAGSYASAKNYVSTVVGVIEGANLQEMTRWSCRR